MRPLRRGPSLSRYLRPKSHVSGTTEPFRKIQFRVRLGPAILSRALEFLQAAGICVALSRYRKRVRGTSRIEAMRPLCRAGWAWRTVQPSALPALGNFQKQTVQGGFNGKESNWHGKECRRPTGKPAETLGGVAVAGCVSWLQLDRKSTRLNSSHLGISYA